MKESVTNLLLLLDLGMALSASLLLALALLQQSLGHENMIVRGDGPVSFSDQYVVQHTAVW